MIRFAKPHATQKEMTLERTRFRPWVRPDFVFRKERLVIFIDGCFWHGCPLHGTTPRSNRLFWSAKISRNRERDRKNDRALLALGWKVLHFWEHSLASKETKRVQSRLMQALRRRETKRPRLAPRPCG